MDVVVYDLMNIVPTLELLFGTEETREQRDGQVVVRGVAVDHRDCTVLTCVFKPIGY